MTDRPRREVIGILPAFVTSDKLPIREYVMSQPTLEETVQQMNSHLSQFKEMSHRAKLRIEKLAELSLVIEDELKQKEYADRVSELFSIANSFESKLEELISDYEIERNRMQNEGG